MQNRQLSQNCILPEQHVISDDLFVDKQSICKLHLSFLYICTSAKWNCFNKMVFHGLFIIAASRRCISRFSHRHILPYIVRSWATPELSFKLISRTRTGSSCRCLWRQIMFIVRRTAGILFIWLNCSPSDSRCFLFADRLPFTATGCKSLLAALPSKQWSPVPGLLNQHSSNKESHARFLLLFFYLG